MEIQQLNTNVTKASFEVSGVSRSGRVRKKSSKLLDFQSPDELESKKPKRTLKTTPRYNGRGRPPKALKARRALITEQLDELSQEDDDDDDEDMDMPIGRNNTHNATANTYIGTDAENGVNEMLDENQLTNNSVHSDNALLSGTAGGTADSDDELDNLVADLVEGVEAESLGADGNPNDTRVRQSLYMIEKSNKRKMLKDGKVITGKLERKDKGKSRYTAYSMWARELRKSGKFGKTQDLDFCNTARRLGELWANVSNKEKNAWRRKAKKLSSKERQRDKTNASNARKANLAQSLNHLNDKNNSNNNNAAISNNNNNTNFLNRATTSRTRKLAAERVKQQQDQQQQQQQQQQKPQVSAQSAELTGDSNSNNNSSSSPTTPTQLRQKRTYTQRAKSKRITNGNLSITKTNDTIITNSSNSHNNSNNNQKRLEPRKTIATRSANSVEYGIKTAGSLANKHAASTTTTNTTTTTPHSTQILSSSHPKPHSNAHTASASVSTQTIEPIDAAAHLKLLGESLTIIGERLKEHDGQIALSGSLSVLLDSLICSLGPLMCLTTYIPGLEKNQQLKTNLAATLDNIAYVMPGL